MAILFHTNDLFHVKQKNTLKKWIKETVEENNKKCGDINLIILTDEELKEMNITHLDHDYYTDIITFNYNQKEKISGDLFISIDRVKENALNFAKNTEEELHRVMIHGVWHLLGYGDKTKKEEEKMRALEDHSLAVLHKTFHVEQLK